MADTLSTIRLLLDHADDLDGRLRRRLLDVLGGAADPGAAAGRDELSERQAARLLSIAHTTLHRWRQGKLQRLPAFPFTVRVTPMGRVRYSRAEIDHYAVHCCSTQCPARSSATQETPDHAQA